MEALAGEDESYDEYVPLRERRRREAERRTGKLGKNRRDKERELLERERWAGSWARKGIVQDGRVVVLPSRVSYYLFCSLVRLHVLECRGRAACILPVWVPGTWFVPGLYRVPT